MAFNPDNYYLTQGTLNSTSSFRKYNSKKIDLKKEEPLNTDQMRRAPM